MSGACTTLVDDGVIRGVIATVDCQTRAYAQGGYMALTSGSPVFQALLTALLTIFVALIGYRMLFARGDTRLSDAPWIALRIGLILALVTSWSTFQTLVFDVADRAPVEIAAIASAPLQGSSGSSLAARPVDGLQAAYEELTQTAIAYGRVAGQDAKSYSSPQAAAAEAVGLATGVLFFSSAGVISASKLTIGVLTAVGPLFIVLALIEATRGLFVGWVRAMVAAALTTLVTWLLVVLMLTVLDPWLTTLADQRRGQALDPQTAISAAALIFVFGAGQMALTLGAIVMAMSFRLPTLGSSRDSDGRTAGGAAARGDPTSVLPQPSRAERLAYELQRDTAQSETRSRAVAMAAATSPGRQTALVFEDRPRLGDTYRRPAVSARRVEAAR
jgi:type IV secretion system protein VirB6